MEKIYIGTTTYPKCWFLDQRFSLAEEHLSCMYQDLSSHLAPQTKINMCMWKLVGGGSCQGWNFIGEYGIHMLAVGESFVLIACF